ncbi:hypothetical protein FS837_006087 [Tulasnella sp. UAMH 9824]|nr:hypothetical protein FS837_006087 [Tulasnella sp. UAMH 9824]
MPPSWRSETFIYEKEWDDTSPDPEVLRSKETREEKNTDRSNEPRDAPPGSSVPKKEDHSQGSKAAQRTEAQSASTSSQREEEAKQLPKKKSKRSAKENTKTDRPGGALPSTEAHADPLQAGQTPTQPAEIVPSGARSSSEQQSPAPQLASALDQDMVDVESPQIRFTRELSPATQIPAEEDFGEGPIIPDDEGLSSFIPRNPAPAEQSGSAGSGGLNMFSTHGSTEQHGEGSSRSGGDVPVEAVETTVGVWSLYYEKPSTTFQISRPEES